jgi:hypothetical protein
MFAIHETTRRRVCRTAFVALCVAPTLATAGWIASHHAPGADARIGRQFSELLGARIDVHGWRQPKPSTVRSAGAEVNARDGEAAELLTLSRLESRSGGSRQLHLIEQAAVDCDRLGALASVAERYLAALLGGSEEIRVERLAVVRRAGGQAGVADRELALSDVQATIECGPRGELNLRASARLPGGEGQTPLILRASAKSASDRSTTVVALDAQSAALPAWAIASVAPGFSAFGEAGFTGVVQWSLGERESSGVARGRLESVELASLLPAGGPHVLDGLAAVEITEMSWRGARIERLSGSLHAENAHMSRSLIEAMVQNFRCPQLVAGAALGDGAGLVALDALAVRFQIDGEGLTFWGDCRDERLPEGAMAASGGQAVLVQPPYRNWNPGVLIQTLAAPAAAWLPATREALEMARRLPLPTGAESAPR